MFAGVMREYPLYTPYGHAGIVVDCPYGRTMFECILVLSLSYLYVHAGIAVGCSYCRCMIESVLVMRLSTQVSLRPVHVAGLCGPVVTCFPVGMLPGPADRCSRPRLHEREGARRAAVGRVAPTGRTCPQAPGGNWPDGNTCGIDNYPVCLRNSGQ